MPARAPDRESLWVNTAWRNPRYTGDWQVIAVVEREVRLRRCEDNRPYEALLVNWPGSWMPAPEPELVGAQAERDRRAAASE